MKKLTSILLALVMALTLCTAAWAADPTVDTSWCTGDVTTYTIRNDAQLRGLAKLVNDGTYTFEGKTIQLGADIDLNNVEWTPIGNWDASKDFKGEFDGNGKTISNLKMSLGDRGNNKVRAGLFASLAGYVHNLTISGVNITGSGTNIRAGALGGNIWTYGRVDNVTVKDVTINATGELYVGGLAGLCYDAGVSGQGKLKNIEVKNVDIIAGGSVNAGGVNGYHNGYFDVDNVDAANVTITVTATSECRVGGFFGADALGGAYDYKGCDVSGVSVTIGGTAKVVAGGFGGYARGGQCWAAPNIANCTTQGTVTNNNTSVETIIGGYYGSSDGGQRGFSSVTADVDINSAVGTVGGFVGASTETWYENKQEYSGCQVLGDVNGGVAGGFIGAGSRATVTNCEVKGNVSGDVAGGFVGKITRQGTGEINGIKIEDAEVDGIVTGKTAAGGLIGDATTSNGEYEPISVSNSSAAPVVVGTTSDAVVSATVAKEADNSNVTVDVNSGNSNGAVIKGNGVTVATDPNTNITVITAPVGTVVNGEAITEAERIDGTNGKVIPTMTLSAESGSMKAGKTVTFTYTFTGDGAITATSSNPAVATVTVDKGSKTVTVTGVSAGSVTITVKVEETDAYDAASADYTVEVTRNQHRVKSNATPTETVESPKTFDAGIAVYGVMAVSSIMGMGYVGKKKF